MVELYLLLSLYMLVLIASSWETSFVRLVGGLLECVVEVWFLVTCGKFVLVELVLWLAYEELVRAKLETIIIQGRIIPHM